MKTRNMYRFSWENYRYKGDIVTIQFLCHTFFLIFHYDILTFALLLLIEEMNRYLFALGACTCVFSSTSDIVLTYKTNYLVDFLLLTMFFQFFLCSI